MDAAIAQKKLPGAVVLIGHNNHIAFEKAYGNRALEPTLEPMTEDTLFDMASLTKVLVTTTAILQLYEQHKLDLDAPVAHYLPTFAAASRYPEASASGLSADKDEGGLQPLGYASQAATWKSQITIRQLLTHYSGLPEDVDLKDDWGLQKPDKPEGIRRALAAIPYGPPGLTFKYSDINFITLGYLVETLSAQPLDLYARDHIFAPLGMTSTAYHSFARTCGPIKKVGSAIEFASNVTANTNADGTMSVSIADYACPPPSWIPQGIIPQTAPTAHDTEGTPTTNPDFDHILRGTVHDPTTRRMGGVAGHAGVFSTAQDMSLFCQALLDKLLKNTGPFPLKQSTLRLATSPQRTRHSRQHRHHLHPGRPDHQRRSLPRPRLGPQLPLLPPPRRDLPPHHPRRRWHRPSRLLRPHRLHRHQPLARPHLQHLRHPPRQCHPPPSRRLHLPPPRPGSHRRRPRPRLGSHHDGCPILFGVSSRKGWGIERSSTAFFRTHQNCTSS